MNYEMYSRRLERIQQRILRRLKDTGEYGLTHTPQEELGELSVYDNHPADIASELFEREKDLALRDNDRLQLRAVKRALQALETGIYGICTHCGESINEERLDALPTATLCTQCKELEEGSQPDRVRPIEEAYLYPGYGRTNLDDTSFVEFDGEDAWQAVARFNERPEFLNDEDAGYLDDNAGLVEDTDGISNELYKRGRLS